MKLNKKALDFTWTQIGLGLILVVTLAIVIIIGFKGSFGTFKSITDVGDKARDEALGGKCESLLFSINECQEKPFLGDPNKKLTCQPGYEKVSGTFSDCNSKDGIERLCCRKKET